jgi:hypothetical protein
MPSVNVNMNTGLSMLNIPGIMPSNITSLQFTNPIVNQQQQFMIQ